MGIYLKKLFFFVKSDFLKNSYYHCTSSFYILISQKFVILDQLLLWLNILFFFSLYSICPPYNCPIEKCTFKSRNRYGDFLNHYSIRHKPGILEGFVKEALDDLKLKYKCKLCDFVGGDETIILRHISKHHQVCFFLYISFVIFLIILTYNTLHEIII